MGEKKILVADDETHILHVVSLKLRNAGFNVLTARDGQEALELAQSELPDLIITDYHMPQLSGLELCQRLKQDPATSGIPAIMLPPGEIRPAFRLESTVGIGSVVSCAVTSMLRQGKQPHRGVARPGSRRRP